MNRICDMFNLEYSVTNDAVFIKTPFGRWIVYLKGDEVKELHHENYRSRRGEPLNAHKKCIDGYHKQKLVSNKCFQMFVIHKSTTFLIQKYSLTLIILCIIKKSQYSF